MTQVVNRTANKDGSFVRPWLVLMRGQGEIHQGFSTKRQAEAYAKAKAEALVNSADIYVVKMFTYYEAIRVDEVAQAI